MFKKMIVTLCFAGALTSAQAQTKENDIPVENLPPAVKEVLNKYISILRSSKTIDECATAFGEIAGGTLINSDGQSVTSSTKQFGLKKDFNDIKVYADPIIITRVNATPSNGQGYGATKIKGMVYKVWIRKKDPANGMPAPVSIMVPEGHASITTPKVINVGSY